MSTKGCVTIGDIEYKMAAGRGLILGGYRMGRSKIKITIKEVVNGFKIIQKMDATGIAVWDEEYIAKDISEIIPIIKGIISGKLPESENKKLVIHPDGGKTDVPKVRRARIKKSAILLDQTPVLPNKFPRPKTPTTNSN